MARFILIFFVLLIVIGLNIPDGFISRLGVEASYLIVALLAFVITGLIAHERLALIVLIIAMCVGANLPEEYASSLGIDRDYLTAGLIALLITPFIRNWLD